MDSRRPEDAALGSLRTDSARWTDESPEEIEVALGDLIRGYVQRHQPRRLLLRMHPEAWNEIRTWVRNVWSRWPETREVKVVCNPEQDRQSISLTDSRLKSDHQCQRRRPQPAWRAAKGGGDGAG